jgi:hypothetical protein
MVYMKKPHIKKPHMEKPKGMKMPKAKAEMPKPKKMGKM